MTSELSLPMATPRSMSERHPHSPYSTRRVFRFMRQTCVRSDKQELATAISAAILELDATLYGSQCTAATTYLDERIVLCLLEGTLVEKQDTVIAGGSRAEFTDRSDAFQTYARAEFTRAVERLTHRRVKASKSSRTALGGACELFLLDSAALTFVGRDQASPTSIRVP
jgi:hypothetical protein